MSRQEELAANLARVRGKIAALAGENPPELLPVTKFHPVEEVAMLAELGVTDVAENREQEARAKAAALPQLRFHMIGQIQTKKANQVARWAASVHSVDSVRLCQALDRGAALALERGERTTRLQVFVQLSHDGDTARGGCPYHQVDEVVTAVLGSEYLELAGFMVVPPLGAAPREVFAAARVVTDQYAETTGLALRLSAGMSADLPDAIAAGTNIVRVGTEIMGPRRLT